MAKRTIRLTETQLHRVIKESVRRILRENVEYDDAGAISDALANIGWAYSDSQDVTHRETGRNGIRWRIEPYPNNLNGVEPADFETVKSTMTQLLGVGNVEFSGGQNRYAPEIKFATMITLEPQQMGEGLRRELRENDDFTSHGYFTTSNYGGYEVEISNSGDAARFRQNFGDGPGEVTDWCEIQYDENGNAYCDTPFGVQELGNYMRHQ